MLTKDLFTLCDFYAKKKNVKEKNEIYDESILVKNKMKYNQLFNHNESHSKLLADNYFDNDEIDEEKCSSLSPLRNAAVHNYLEEDLSLIEKTAQRVKPIIQVLCEKLVKEKTIDNYQSIDKEPQIETQVKNDKNQEINVNNSQNIKKPAKKIEPDMRIVLGYLNQLEMIANLNIGNIMQIVPVRIEDLLSVPRNETEFNRASFIEKISLL